MDSAFTTQPFQFMQSPMCNYIETVTISGLPSFVTYNDATKDFTITADSADYIGVYNVEIISKISLPDDASKLLFSTMTAMTTFQITVQPLNSAIAQFARVLTDSCQVDSLIQTGFVKEMTYVLGTPGFFSDSYDFEQHPNCDYEISIVKTNFPNFMKHCLECHRFEIPYSTDTKIIGEYEFTYRTSITTPSATGPKVLFVDELVKIYI